MTFIKFWKKDLINKLIVITLSLLITGMLVLIYLISHMPTGRSLKGVFLEFLPVEATPTFDISKAPTVSPTAELAYRPTLAPTSAIVDVKMPTETPTAVQLVMPTVTVSAEETAAVSLSSACIPSNAPQNGKVVEVLDGNTVRALIDGLVYVVRYIGVGIPADAVQQKVAERANVDLVYAKEVVLIADETDKDPSGRLLRYVLVGDLFVNLELIQSGLAPATESPGASACDQIFKNAGIATPALPTEQP